MSDDDDIVADDDPMPHFFRPSPLSEHKLVLDKRTFASSLQCGGTDEEVGALFGLDAEGLHKVIDQDEELKRIYEQAPLVGQLAIRKAQHDSALLGNNNMLKHIGEHTLGQVEAKAITVAVDINPLDDDEIARRLAYASEIAKQSLLEKQTIEIEAIEVIEDE